jgi:hypothetical protein
MSTHFHPAVLKVHEEKDKVKEEAADALRKKRDAVRMCMGFFACIGIADLVSSVERAHRHPVQIA